MSEKEQPKKAGPAGVDTKAAEPAPKAADLLAIYAETKELATRQERQAAEARAALAAFKSSAAARLAAIAEAGPLAVAAQNAAASGLIQGQTPAEVLAAVDGLTVAALQLQHQGY